MIKGIDICTALKTLPGMGWTRHRCWWCLLSVCRCIEETFPGRQGNLLAVGFWGRSFCQLGFHCLDRGIRRQRKCSPRASFHGPQWRRGQEHVSGCCLTFIPCPLRVRCWGRIHKGWLSGWALLGRAFCPEWLLLVEVKHYWHHIHQQGAPRL